MPNMKFCALWLAVGSALIVSGCATGSGVALNAPRAATNPADVRLYTEPPKRYEVIGLVEGTSEGGGFQRPSMRRAVEELRVQAAKLGANGVLIDSTGDAQGGMVGGFAGNMMYAGHIPRKSASGRAIVVHEE
jgi:hypothetical protein